MSHLLEDHPDWPKNTMTTPTPSKNKHLPTPITEQYIGRQLQDRPEWVDAELCRDFERELAAAQEARQADEDRLWSAIGGREAHWIEHHDEDGTLRRDQLTLEGALIFLHGASERSQRAEAIAEQCRTDTEIAERHQAAAEALAEANAKDAERYRKYLEIYDTEELTAAEWNGSNAITDHIDATIAEGKKP